MADGHPPVDSSTVPTALLWARADGVQGHGRPREPLPLAPPQPPVNGHSVNERGPSPLALLMAAEISRLQKEHPEIDRAIVQKLYTGYVHRVQWPPDVDQARDYVQRVIAGLDQDVLRRELRLAQSSDADRASEPKPRRGRPKGSHSVPCSQIIDVFRSLRTDYGRAPTQDELAANLSPRIERRTLQAHLKAYGLPWPIE